MAGEVLYIIVCLAIKTLDFITILFSILEIILYYKTLNNLTIIINAIIIFIIFNISKYGILIAFFGNRENLKDIKKEILILLISICISMILDYIIPNFSYINIIKNVCFSIYLLATIKAIIYMINDREINIAQRMKKKAIA